MHDVPAYLHVLLSLALVLNICGHAGVSGTGPSPWGWRAPCAGRSRTGRAARLLRARGGAVGMAPNEAHRLARVNMEIGMEIVDMKRRRERFIREETQILEYFKPRGAVSAKARGGQAKVSRRAGRMTEHEEDQALLRHTEEEEAGNTITQKMARMLPLRAQPGNMQSGELRAYQLEGINWLASLYVNGASGILADEMGLGKTVQTVAMLALLMECGAKGPFLILAPKSTLSNWANEFAKWLPHARVLLLQGSKDERQTLIHDVLRPGNFDVVLTSYEMMLRESAELTRRHWRYVAIDEAHRIKNEESMLALVARQLQTNGRLLITGTPLQNNLHELWALLNFVLPDEFHSADDFLNFFSGQVLGCGVCVCVCVCVHSADNVLNFFSGQMCSYECMYLCTFVRFVCISMHLSCMATSSTSSLNSPMAPTGPPDRAGVWPNSRGCWHRSCCDV